MVSKQPCLLAVIWIDWYPYHVARFKGLESSPLLSGRVAGIEMVGGIGVHAGLRFREDLPEQLGIETLMPGTSWREANQWKLAAALWRKLSALDPEVVLVPGYYTLPAIAAALWARLHGSASVLMTESCAMDHGRSAWKEWVKGVGMRALFGWAITGGRLHVDYLRQLGFPADRIAGCYDVVDNAFFRNGAEELRSRTKAAPEPYFLYVGRFAEEKNVSGLLQSWFLYRENGGTWPLMLVGDGPEAVSLKTLAAKSRYGGQVLFPGLKSSRELLPYYAFAGCFVLPSTREPWGLVVNEAMAAGLPAIVSDRCGCAADLVSPGQNGYVFDPVQKDAESKLAGLLTRIAALTVQQRLEMGMASAEILRGFSPERFGLAVASIAAAVGQRRMTLETVPEGTR